MITCLSVKNRMVWIIVQRIFTTLSSGSVMKYASWLHWCWAWSYICLEQQWLWQWHVQATCLFFCLYNKLSSIMIPKEWETFEAELSKLNFTSASGNRASLPICRPAPPPQYEEKTSIWSEDTQVCYCCLFLDVMELWIDFLWKDDCWKRRN